MNITENTIQRFAYLLDQDNHIYENKLFIDLMWYIKKEIESNTKSYVIRNSAIMLQQLFYWHYKYLKEDKETTYQYNLNGEMVNTIKMDFQDWWESIRLTDKEITSANKFLVSSGLITIVKMRIKQKDKEVYKPSSCYILNTNVLAKYLDKLVEIQSTVYNEKVTKVREKNNESSKKRNSKIKEFTDLSTENSVTTETGVTLKLQSLEGTDKKLSTLSTENMDNNGYVTTETGVTKATTETGVTKVTTETEVTKVTTETEVTKATTETEVTNKSNMSCTDISCANISSPNISCTDKEFSPIWNNILSHLGKNISEVALETWFISGIEQVSYKNNSLIIRTYNNFTKEIISSKHLNQFNKAIYEVIKVPIKIEFI